METTFSYYEPSEKQWIHIISSCGIVCLSLGSDALENAALLHFFCSLYDFVLTVCRLQTFLWYLVWLSMPGHNQCLLFTSLCLMKVCCIQDLGPSFDGRNNRWLSASQDATT